jgi:hypothetical protein
MIDRIARLWPRPALRRSPDQRRCHRAMFAVDIAGFGGRPAHLHVALRKTMYSVIQGAVGDIGLSWRRCEYTDCGDGAVIILDADLEVLLNPLVTHIATALRAHNRSAGGDSRIQLRMAVHAGYVQLDEHGFTGPDVNHLFRLLEAPELKANLVSRHDDLALIVSEYVYNHATGYNMIEPGEYRQVGVIVKETVAKAWLRASTTPQHTF